jgi:hypothetical protein
MIFKTALFCILHVIYMEFWVILVKEPLLVVVCINYVWIAMLVGKGGGLWPRYKYNIIVCVFVVRIS